jgi:flagellar hook-basal body complex protein FliE
MSDMKIDDVLRQIRELSRQAGFDGPEQTGAADKPDFSAMLGQTLDQVNQNQKSAKELANAFEAGDPNINLSQVMVEMQKARVSFEALSQVRNKLISAYQEIMNMQI